MSGGGVSTAQETRNRSTDEPEQLGASTEEGCRWARCLNDAQRRIEGLEKVNDEHIQLAHQLEDENIRLREQLQKVTSELLVVKSEFAKTKACTASTTSYCHLDVRRKVQEEVAKYRKAYLSLEREVATLRAVAGRTLEAAIASPHAMAPAAQRKAPPRPLVSARHGANGAKPKPRFCGRGDPNGLNSTAERDPLHKRLVKWLGPLAAIIPIVRLREGIYKFGIKRVTCRISPENHIEVVFNGQASSLESFLCEHMGAGTPGEPTSSLKSFLCEHLGAGTPGEPTSSLESLLYEDMGARTPEKPGAPTCRAADDTRSATDCTESARSTWRSFNTTSIPDEPAPNDLDLYTTEPYQELEDD